MQVVEPAVLVVEDDPLIRDLMMQLLEPEGYRVFPAADGQTALERLHAGGVDLVLLDRMLPDIDGLEICRRARAEPRSATLPIIMVTALGQDGDTLAGFAAGVDDY